MKKIVGFLLSFIVILGYLLYAIFYGYFSNFPDEPRLPFLCILMGGFGGSLYCLRAVYLNACIKKQWDDGFQPWYYIRPFISLICGGISYVFLKAGLLILESIQKTDSSNLGFLALAFVAGLNVDNFINKIENIAHASWGIEKSRTSKD